jgi:predicted ATPase
MFCCNLVNSQYDAQYDTLCLHWRFCVARLDTISVRGFKSIQNLENFPLGDISVLIGGNGAGKSNFIEIFRFLRAMMELPSPGLPSGSLAKYVADGGGSAAFLFNGPKETSQIDLEMGFGDNGYRFSLVATQDNTLRIDSEATRYVKSPSWHPLDGDGNRPGLLKDKDEPGIFTKRGVGYYVYQSITSWQIYHFHDTGRTSPIKQAGSVDDFAYLRFDGANLAPYLLHLKTGFPKTYENIVRTIRCVAPFFNDFILQPDTAGMVRLLWTQKGSDYPMKPLHLSDGTLRFIALATALLQPHPPATILIDEPELGLHPYAIEVFAELVKSRAGSPQIILSTQSPTLVDCFQPEDIIVVDRVEGASGFKKLQAEPLTEWLRDYSLGELWRKNLLQGYPAYE